MPKIGCYAAVKITREQWLKLTAQAMEEINKYDEVFMVVGFDEESNNQYFVSLKRKATAC